MALTQADREFISEAISASEGRQTEALSQALAPLVKQVNRNTDTLFGPMRDDGLVKKVEVLDTNRQKMWKVVGIMTGIWSVVAAAVAFAAHLIR